MSETAEAIDYATKLGWETVDSAPLDGTPVLTGKIGPLSMGVPRYPITSRFLDGKWKAKFREGEWCEYDPQPTHWQASSAHVQWLEENEREHGQKFR